MQLDEKLEISELNRVYGALLTPHQCEMLRLYYDCDISLNELSDMYGISRQAVRDALLRGVRALKEFEDKLAIIRLRRQRRSTVTLITRLIKEGRCEQAVEELGALYEEEE